MPRRVAVAPHRAPVLPSRPRPSSPLLAQPSAPAPPAPPLRPVAPAPAPAPSASWQRALSAWLAAHRVYPVLARARGEQGNVTVRFTVEPSGQVTQVTVLHSSGSALLDAAAKAMLSGARVPRFRGGMADQPVTANVEIRYSLQS